MRQELPRPVAPPRPSLATPHDSSPAAVGTVTIDAELRLRRFTPGAARLFKLTAQHVGRPIDETPLRLLNLDLIGEARLALNRRQPVRRDYRSPDGRLWLIWSRPSLLANESAQSITITLIDVVGMRTSEGQGPGEADIGPSEPQPMDDAIRRVNEALQELVAEREKWLTLVHDISRAVNDAVSWDEALYLVLRHICSTEGWQIGQVYLPDRQVPDDLVLAIGCVESERFEPFHAASKKLRYGRGQILPGRVFASGEPTWINNVAELHEVLPFRAAAATKARLTAGAALPVTIGAEVIAVLEMFSDQPHPPSPALNRLMADVGAQISRVIERERLMSRAADMVWQEQQDLIHTLHDTLGQELTAAGMLSSGLAEQLKDIDTSAAGVAHQIGAAAQRALAQVRQLSKGLFPVEVAEDGLMLALSQLASTTEAVFGIRCRLDCTAPVLIHDNRVATEFYRIAQEAVTNAVRHARPAEIIIRLGTEAGATVLSVIDDGIGIASAASSGEGSGLRIMRYRAMGIGAIVSVEARAAGGTIVTCTLRQAPRSRPSESD